MKISKKYFQIYLDTQKKRQNQNTALNQNSLNIFYKRLRKCLVPEILLTQGKVILKNILIFVDVNHTKLKHLH